MDVLELADRLWRGETTTAEHHPLAPAGELAVVSDGVAFLSEFANVSVFRTGDGLVLVDSGGPFAAANVHRRVREFSPDPVRVVVFSHGHIDHVFGVGPFDEEARTAGTAPPQVIAHHRLPERFARYRRSAGYNAVINRRQFGIEQLDWPTAYREPDDVYDGIRVLDVAGEPVELHHSRGETDDHTWTWWPDRRVICSGDLFIWAAPNAGNPQKVQRYPREWALALREMAALDPDVLLPGHGVPVIGADRVAQALGDTARYLETIHDDTLAMMNAGAPLDDILHSVRPPAELADRPYLQPVYDDPEFIVRSVWREYGGWYDGRPDELKPAPRGEVARELAALAGGADVLADRALALLAAGRSRTAAHLARLAYLAAPDDAAVAAAHTRVFATRRDEEPSTMAKGILGAAARDSDVPQVE